MILSFLFPPKCIFCGKTLPAAAELAVCGDCAREVSFYGSDLMMESGERGNARGCDCVVCALAYEGAARASLARYKFRQRPEYGRTYAALLCEKLRRVEAARAFDVVTCVPLSASRERERGYNQAGIVAEYVAGYFGRAYAGRLMRRSGAALRQSGLQRQERAANARAAFAVDPREAQKAGLAGKDVLLVDDIATTLSTLSACAMALKEAGARRVIGGVIASR
ncbi:MAG: hypothetical protein LBJ10_04600 [Clostridiales bacterium]|jgi:ComF family protein|nr:hypothetical protein [Clostridiales bacterium]